MSLTEQEIDSAIQRLGPIYEQHRQSIINDLRGVNIRVLQNYLEDPDNSPINWPALHVLRDIAQSGGSFSGKSKKYKKSKKKHHKKSKKYHKKSKKRKSRRKRR